MTPTNQMMKVQGPGSLLVCTFPTRLFGVYSSAEIARRDFGDISQLTNWDLHSGVACHMTPDNLGFVPARWCISGTSNIANRSTLWHGKVKIESEYLGGNNFFEHAEQKLVLKLKKLGAKVL